MPILDEGLYSTRGYIAPTVYRLKGSQVNQINYYSDLAYAVSKYYFLSNQGGADISPDGQISFDPSNPNPQTLGINADFYILQNGTWQIASYGYLKGLLTGWPPMVFRFYTTDGNGPYYAIFNPDIMGISATPVDSVTPDQLTALDSLYREAQLLKYRYNSLVGFLNTLSQRTLTPTEQQIFNDGTLRLNAMTAQMGQLQGIEFTFTSSGAVIGFVPLLIIAIVAILAVVASYTVLQIEAKRDQVKLINDSYQLNEWVANKKLEVAQKVQAGEITQDQANEINKNLDNAQSAATKIADNATKATEGGIFSNIASILQWGLIGYLAIQFVPVIKNQLSKKNG